MARTVSTLFFVLLMISLATCQTFQYSRGWTNGKRAELSPVMLDYKSSSSSHASNLQAQCANLHKWNGFVHQNDNEDVCRVPCEFLDVLRQCLLHYYQQEDKVAGSSTSYKSSVLAPASSSNSGFY